MHCNLFIFLFDLEKDLSEKPSSNTRSKTRNNGNNDEIIVLSSTVIHAKGNFRNLSFSQIYICKPNICMIDFVYNRSIGIKVKTFLI